MEDFAKRMEVRGDIAARMELRVDRKPLVANLGIWYQKGDILEKALWVEVEWLAP